MSLSDQSALKKGQADDFVTDYGGENQTGDPSDHSDPNLSGGVQPDTKDFNNDDESKDGDRRTEELDENQTEFEKIERKDHHETGVESETGAESETGEGGNKLEQRVASPSFFSVTSRYRILSEWVNENVARKLLGGNHAEISQKALDVTRLWVCEEISCTRPLCACIRHIRIVLLRHNHLSSRESMPRNLLEKINEDDKFPSLVDEYIAAAAEAAAAVEAAEAAAAEAAAAVEAAEAAAAVEAAEAAAVPGDVDDADTAEDEDEDEDEDEEEDEESVSSTEDAATVKARMTERLQREKARSKAREARSKARLKREKARSKAREARSKEREASNLIGTEMKFYLTNLNTQANIIFKEHDSLMRIVSQMCERGNRTRVSNYTGESKRNNIARQNQLESGTDNRINITSAMSSPNKYDEVMIPYVESIPLTVEASKMNKFALFLSDLFKHSKVCPMDRNEIMIGKINETMDIIVHWKPDKEFTEEDMEKFYRPSGLAQEASAVQPILFAIMWKIAKLLGIDCNIVREQFIPQQDTIRGPRFADGMLSSIKEMFLHGAAGLLQMMIEMKPLSRKNSNYETLLDEGRNQVIGHLALILRDSCLNYAGGLGRNGRVSGILLTMISIEVITLELTGVGTSAPDVKIFTTKSQPLFDDETVAALRRKSDDDEMEIKKSISEASDDSASETTVAKPGLLLMAEMIKKSASGHAISHESVEGVAIAPFHLANGNGSDSSDDGGGKMSAAERLALSSKTASLTVSDHLNDYLKSDFEQIIPQDNFVSAKAAKMENKAEESSDDSDSGRALSVDGNHTKLFDDDNTDAFCEFELGTYLGSGGFSVVYQASRRTAGAHTDYVVKTPKTIAVISNLKNELDFLRKLNHPNVPKGVDMARICFRERCEQNTVKCLVLNAPVGSTAMQVMKRSPEHNNPDLLKQVVQQTELALKHAHSQKVIHLDIRPSNIIVSGDDSLTPKLRVQVTDWGCAFDLGKKLKRYRGCPPFSSVDLLKMRGKNQQWKSITTQVKHDFVPLAFTVVTLVHGEVVWPGFLDHQPDNNALRCRYEIAKKTISTSNIFDDEMKRKLLLYLRLENDRAFYRVKQQARKTSNPAKKLTLPPDKMKTTQNVGLGQARKKSPVIETSERQERTETLNEPRYITRSIKSMKAGADSPKGNPRKRPRLESQRKSPRKGGSQQRGR